MPETRSPLARLIIVMIFLALAGSIIGGLHYYSVDLPHQNAVQAPTNSNSCSDPPKWCAQVCYPVALNSRDAYYACLQDLGCC
nr:hypothetical protein [uncultured Methanoregula sp.]